MIKKILLCTLCIFSLQLSWGQDASSIIKIKGSSEVSVKPSLTIISLNISTIRVDYSRTVNDLSERINLLVKSLRQKGFKDSEIITSNFSINKNTIYQKGTRKDSGFVATQTLRVEFEYDQKKFLNVLNSLTQSSADADLSIEFDLTKEQKSKVRDELIELAVKDAERKAKLIAITAGQKLNGIREISYGINTSQSPFSNRTFASENVSFKANARISNFEAQDLVLTDEVYIIYQTVPDN